MWLVTYENVVTLYIGDNCVVIAMVNITFMESKDQTKIKRGLFPCRDFLTLSLRWHRLSQPWELYCGERVQCLHLLIQPLNQITKLSVTAKLPFHLKMSLRMGGNVTEAWLRSSLHLLSEFLGGPMAHFKSTYTAGATD